MFPFQESYTCTTKILKKMHFYNMKKDNFILTWIDIKGFFLFVYENMLSTLLFEVNVNIVYSNLNE